MCLNHGILSATVGKNVHFLNISQGQLEPKAVSTEYTNIEGSKR